MRTLADDWLLALDPVRFAAIAGYTLDDWQRHVVTQRPHRLLLNCARGVGKSFVSALLATHQAIYEPGSLAVVAGVGQRQALETIRVCRELYTAARRPVPAESENKLSLELANGSRVISIPTSEETVRGLHGVRLLVLDEASRIPDAFYGAVLPFLAVSDGALALLSTPAGRRGFYFRAYQRRVVDGWHYEEIPAEQCSRIRASFLAEMRRTTSEAFYAQEFCCAFNDATTGAFRQEDIDRAFQHYPRWHLGRFTSTADTERRAAHQDDAEVEQLLPQQQQKGMGTWNLARFLPGSTPSRP